MLLSQDDLQTGAQKECQGVLSLHPSLSSVLLPQENLPSKSKELTLEAQQQGSQDLNTTGQKCVKFITEPLFSA